MNYYITSDLALAGAISLYFPLDSLDRSNPNKVLFQFQRLDGLDDLIQSYWRNELKIEPQAYFYQLKALKAQLYEQR